MSPKEGSRIPTPADVVEISPDKKANRRRSRLLAPILLGTALALGGGERNGTNAQGTQPPSSETLSTNIFSSIEHIDVGLPNIDPITGEVIGGSWQDYLLQLDNDATSGGENSITQEYPDPSQIELLPIPPELQSRYDKINSILNGLTRFGQPKNPGDLEKWKFFKDQENKQLTAPLLDLIIASLERSPPQIYSPKGERDTHLPQYFYVLFNGLQCTCGLNTYASDGKSMITFTIQDGISFDMGLIGHPFYENVGEMTQFVLAHELGHLLKDGDEPYPSYLEDVGWYRDQNGVNGWNIREWSEVFRTITDPTGSQPDKFRFTPREQYADFIGGLNVKPSNISRMPIRHILHLAKRFPNWQKIIDDPDVSQRIIEVMKNPPPPLPTNTPTPSPTLPTRTPTFTPTPSPTKTTPESFTVFLPISHSGEIVNTTPEPEERFGTGKDLSDARRFIPNYENRRNRKGR